MPDLTVLIPCRNNRAYLEALIPTCSWADAVFVVDSFSEDGSGEAAVSLGAQVLQHEYENSSRQKNRALDLIRTEWVFQIDTDEAMESGLENEILAVIANAGSEISAFRLPRKNHYGPHWLRHGGLYPDYQTRLLRTKRCRWSEREVHAQVIVDGEIGTLRGHIIHHGMPGIAKQLSNLDRYTNYERDEWLKTGKAIAPHRLLWHPPLVFAYRAFWRGGIRDGWRGVVLAMYAAFYDMVRIAKLLEHTDDHPTP
ncbi:MAG: glycosyltransferase family 2 protein [Bacteroidia bacterium]|nr:glycosyltransferase family 2 protein [Bacteroidia bacterium]